MTRDLKCHVKEEDFNKNSAKTVYIRYNCNLMRQQNNRQKTLRFDTQRENIHDVMYF